MSQPNKSPLKPKLEIEISNSNTKPVEETSAFNAAENNSNKDGKVTVSQVPDAASPTNAAGKETFKISLQHHYKENDSLNISSDSYGGTDGDVNNTTNTASSGEYGSVRATAINECSALEPHVELIKSTSCINAINSAYNSTGYPSTAANTNIRGMVYGSFVDTMCCGLDSLSLPPRTTLLFGHCRRPSHANTNDIETLLKVVWKRAPAVFSGQDSPNSIMSNTPTAPPPTTPTTSSQQKNPPPGAKALSPFLQQYPEGVHGINTSAFLRQLVLYGTLPTPEQIEAEKERQIKSYLEKNPKATAATPADYAKMHNVAPAPVPEEEWNSCPVQRTLTAANTFNHLSLYFTAHQDGKILYHTPIATLSASIHTRKITAQCLFLLGKEEVDPDTGVDTFEKSTSGHYDFFSSGNANSPMRKRENSLSGSHQLSSDNTGGQRDTIHFKNVPVAEDEYDLIFPADPCGANHGVVVDADQKAKTINTAVIGFVVEPLLLFGNQNGDIFLFSILQERIVQRINYNYGYSNPTHNELPERTANTHKFVKVVNSPVAAIEEVENGVERKLMNMIEFASVAKRNGKSSFRLAAENSNQGNEGTKPKSNYAQRFYDVTPSLFAVGFDNGHVLLVCVAEEEGYMLSHFGMETYGLYSIKCVTTRLPNFFKRLWVGYNSVRESTNDNNNNNSSRSGVKKAPQELLLISESVLFVHNEENKIAAIACNGGTIALARLPSLELLASVNTYEYNAVGNIIALKWVPSNAKCLAAPDLLLASGEDDMLTCFQLNNNALFTANSDVYSSSLRMRRESTSASYSNNHNNDRNSSSNDSHNNNNTTTHDLANGLLRIREKKRFHRSWITHLTLLPLVVPAAKTLGMPQYLGVTAVATSFDNTVSFWPILFPVENAAESYRDEALLIGSPTGAGGGTQRCYIVKGPTAAHALDKELTTCAMVCGTGTSYFLVTLSCRGEVKVWSSNLKNVY